jgi:endonuclease-3 related protein
MPKGFRKKDLAMAYRRLYACFGPQHWWPAKTPFEVMVGAILTQNTNWANVEKALNQLKQNKVLTAGKIHCLSTARLARLIKSAGYYNIKAKRLKEFLSFLFKTYEGNLKKMARMPSGVLRSQLLSVKGIGPETADSILLYALHKPLFVIDAYTKRILIRHRLIPESAGYHDVQNLFMQNLKKDVKLFNEYHALLVRLGKEFCLKRRPRCEVCPLK